MTEEKKGLTKMYRCEYGQPAPVPTFAEIPEYPHLDTDGRKIHVNTHFLELDEAWSAHLLEHEAHLKLTIHNVESLREQTAKAEARLVEATLKLNTIRQERSRRAVEALSSLVKRQQS